MSYSFSATGSNRRAVEVDAIRHLAQAIVNQPEQHSKDVPLVMRALHEALAMMPDDRQISLTVTGSTWGDYQNSLLSVAFSVSATVA